MSKLSIGWIVFFALILTAIFTLKVTEDQYPAYTSMVSKGISKDYADKQAEKNKRAKHDLDLSKHRPTFDPKKN